MQKLLKNFLLAKIESMNLLNTKFYIFQPAQKISISRHKNMVVLSKLCVKDFYKKSLSKELTSVKYPLVFRKASDFRDLFLLLKKEEKNVVLMRCLNFYAMQKFEKMPLFFNTNYNFMVFFKSAVLIFFFLLQLKKIRNSLFFFAMI